MDKWNDRIVIGRFRGEYWVGAAAWQNATDYWIFTPLDAQAKERRSKESKI